MIFQIVCWVVTPCSPADGYTRFGGTCFLSLQGVRCKQRASQKCFIHLKDHTVSQPTGRKIHSAVILKSCFISCKRTDKTIAFYSCPHATRLCSFLCMLLDFRFSQRLTNDIAGDVTLCNPVGVHRYFEGTYSLHLQDRKVSQGSNQQKTDSDFV